MSETENLLLEARDEIKRLRRDNEILYAKVSTMELFATVLHTRSDYPSHGAAIDVCWKIDQLLASASIKAAAKTKLGDVE